MEGALVAAARVIVDSRTGAMAEAGDIVLGIAEGSVRRRDTSPASLARLRQDGSKDVNATDQVTLFKSLGMAVEDVAAAHLAYQRARERGLGVEARL